MPGHRGELPIGPSQVPYMHVDVAPHQEQNELATHVAHDVLVAHSVAPSAQTSCEWDDW